MKPITYALGAGARSSDDYYADVSAFADLLLIETDTTLGPLARRLGAFIRFDRHGRAMSHGEYLLDLLSLGVYWRAYGDRAAHLPRIAAGMLTRLYELRRRNRAMKPHIDRLRGVLATLLLDEDPESKPIVPRPTRDRLRRLIAWLEASGEFRMEVVRLAGVERWLSTLTELGFRRAMSTTIAAAEWFERASIEALGRYTEHVEEYLATGARAHRWREDVLFCARGRVEYHLSMVGAEIMNRALRPSFDRTRRTVVLAPGCMRARTARECEARDTGLDLECTGCTSGCRVDGLRRLGMRKGFDVRLVPHSSDFSRWLREVAAGRGIGVIGIACPLNLIAGGLELREQGVPAQCVLLDECGCSAHWHDEGIPTRINVRQLERVIRRATSHERTTAVAA